MKQTLFTFFIALILSLTSIEGFSQYCVVTNAGGACITNVTFNTLNSPSAGCTGTGNYNFVSATTNVVQGIPYNLTVTNDGVTYGTGIVSVWFDWNHDLALDASEWTQLYTAALTGTVSITVPVGALLGTTRMRVRSRGTGNQNTSTDACLIMGSGETEDYDINVISNTPCAGMPTAGQATTSNATPCFGSSINLSLTGSSLLGGLTYQWQRSASGNPGTWINIVGATTYSYPLTVNNNGNRYYRCIVTCSNTIPPLSDTSASVLTTTQVWSATGPCYCIPTYANVGTLDFISNVTLNTLINPSPLTNVTPSWENFTGSQASGSIPIPFVYVNVLDSIHITQGSDLTNFSAVWFDWNHNNTFDAAEYFSTGLDAGANGTSTIPFTIPPAAISGITRMRVRGGDDVQMLATQGCGATNSTFGESEDYLVNIIPSTPLDPGVTDMGVPAGNCFTNSETVTVGVLNFGQNLLTLTSTNYIVVKLNVTGPNGVTSYYDTLNSGILSPVGNPPSQTATFNTLGGNAVNLFAGGTYTLNTTIITVGFTNGSLLNDSLYTPKTLINYRPTAGPILDICQNANIIPGQGLSVTGCAAPIRDSVTLTFNVTGGPDNIGDVTTGTTQGTANANCANIHAGDFASVLKPSLPPNCTFPVQPTLTITNLGSGFITELRFNLFGGATAGNSTPTLSNLYSYMPQGYNANAGNINIAGQSVGTNANFTHTRKINIAAANNSSRGNIGYMFSDTLSTATPYNPYLHIGYWEAWNDFVATSDITINAGGNPTVATLKIVYEYIPTSINWYANNVTSTVLSTNTPYNPFLATNPVVNNSSVTGDYIFWAACSSSPTCRVADTLRINPAPVAITASMTLCEDAVSSYQAVFDLTTLDNTVSNNTIGINTVTYFTDPALFGPVAFPTDDTTSTSVVYAEVKNNTNFCATSVPINLDVVGLPEFQQPVLTGNACAPNCVDIANIALLNPNPSGATTTLSYFSDAALTIPTSSIVCVASTVYVIAATNTTPACKDTATAYINVIPATNKIVNQLSFGGGVEITDCNTAIAAGNITLADGLTQTLFTPSDCKKVATVTDVVDGTNLGVTSIQETIDCNPLLNWNLQPYVNRVFQITPTNNVPGDVCLYVLDDDFAFYNGNNLTWPQLPTEFTLADTANLAITHVTNGPVGATGSTWATIPTNQINTSFDNVTKVWTICFPAPSFSYFYIHSLNGSNAPLPINLIDFAAKRVGTTSLVSWSTENELNNSHFIVQRSRDGKEFIDISNKINSKAPNGNSTTKLDYDFTDATPANGHNYYRLQQFDQDNKMTQTNAIDVYFGSETMVTLFPNPVTTDLNVEINTPKATSAQVKIMDATGRTISITELPLQIGLNQSQVSMKDLSSGVYMIHISNNKGLNYSQTIRKN